MQNFKKKLITIGTIGTAFVPLISTLACSASPFHYGQFGVSRIDKKFIQDPSMHKNVMSTYFNATDMLAALGYYPDYASLNAGAGQDQKTLYPNYLKPYLGPNNIVKSTKPGYENETGGTYNYKIKNGVRIMDGQVVDRESIAAENISTLLLNEWEKVDENKFTDIVPALIYTSMADGHARYYNESSYQEYAKWGFNVFEAFEMQASGMDAGYQGHDFVREANDLNTLVHTHIETDNALFQAAFTQKTLGKRLLVLEATENNKDIAFYGRSPGVYNILYSHHPQEGLGFDLPTPHDKSNLNYGDFKFTAKDAKTFTDEFKDSADEIIILNDTSKSTYDDIQKNGVSAAASMLDPKWQGAVNQHIHVVNRSNFYDTVWGIIGTNAFLTNISHLFNIQYQAPNIVPPQTQLEQLR